MCTVNNCENVEASLRGDTEVHQNALHLASGNPKFCTGFCNVIHIIDSGSAVNGDPLSTKTRPSESDWTQLNDVITNGQMLDVREWFRAKGLGSNARQDWTINSQWPLQTAAGVGNVEIFDALLDYGFDPMEMSFFGDGLVHTAAASGHTHMVERLFRSGLFVSVRDEEGNTPLHFAAMTTGDNSRMIKYLVGKRADTNARNCFEESPLHVASSKGSIHNVLALTESGASVNVRTSRGMSPLFCAIGRKFDVDEHVQVLCDMGAVSGPCQRRMCEFYAASRSNSLLVIKALVERNFCMSCSGPDWNYTLLYNIAANMDAAQGMRAIDIIVGAGYDIRPDLQWWMKNLNLYPVKASEKIALQKRLLKYATTPTTLRRISCFAIRNILGPSLPSKIDYLPLPDVLKDLVRLKQIL